MIEEWIPGDRLQLRLCEFSLPMSRLAKSVLETWEFANDGQNCKVVRSMEIFPASRLTMPLLWLISFLLKQAIARHQRQMASDSAAVGKE